MQKYTWSVSFWDELDIDSGMNTGTIESADDPDLITATIHLKYLGWSKDDISDLRPSELLGMWETNGEEFRLIQNRGDRGHLFLITVVKLAEI